MKKTLLSIFIFAVTILVCAFSLELYYRYLNPLVLSNTASLSFKKWSKANIHNNRLGFRDKERTIKKAANIDKRVLFLGASNVVGQGISDLNERISERLETKLNAFSDQKYEVVNCGAMTLDLINSSYSILNRYQQMNFEYDSVVLYYKWTAIRHVPDVIAAYRENKAKHYVVQKENKVKDWLSQNSFAYDWLNTVFQDKNYKADNNESFLDWHMKYYRKPEYFKKHINALKLLDNFLKANGRDFYVLITAASYDPVERQENEDVLNAFKQALNLSNVNFVDVTNVFDGYSLDEIRISPYDSHNKPIFYEKMVEELYPSILSKEG